MGSFELFRVSILRAEQCRTKIGKNTVIKLVKSLLFFVVVVVWGLGKSGEANVIPSSRNERAHTSKRGFCVKHLKKQGQQESVKVLQGTRFGKIVKKV